MIVNVGYLLLVKREMRPFSVLDVLNRKFFYLLRLSIAGKERYWPNSALASGWNGSAIINYLRIGPIYRL